MPLSSKVSGGGPSDGMYNQYIGARNFYNPGGFANGFPGLCAVFVTAGTEVVGIAASETPNPRATMPATIRSPTPEINSCCQG
ncbi:hypothetical protein MPER_15868, partial [Moniliophthora perniciosa FA553]